MTGELSFSVTAQVILRGIPVLMTGELFFLVTVQVILRCVLVLDTGKLSYSATAQVNLSCIPVLDPGELSYCSNSSKCFPVLYSGLLMTILQLFPLPSLQMKVIPSVD